MKVELGELVELFAYPSYPVRLLQVQTDENLCTKYVVPGEAEKFARLSFVFGGIHDLT